MDRVYAVTATKRRRYIWAAWWTGAPTREPFRKPDACMGGARTPAEVRARLKAPVAMMEVHVGEGASYEGVVALRTRKAWLGAAEGPRAHAPTEVPAGATRAIEQARAKLVDDVAGTDDELTERYLTEGDLTDEELNVGLSRAVLDNLVCLSVRCPTGGACDPRRK